MVRIVLKGLKETEEFGERLGNILQGGDVLSLTGDLGAGKTTLTKSIGKGLGVNDYITSPTFALINEYKGRVWVYHFDVYRLEGPEDLFDLGYEDYFYSNGVSIIEWGDKIMDILPSNTIEINIEKGEKLDERIVTISGQDNRYSQIVKELNIN
ncbi:tRNA (adenosine(37)-N6)-threonylcarbamoyltransferase complex ATPase subunit type 1 TsaE [Schnuerera sp. xch1]|uniref:tRNA (adenosine(37)-N6)-threonylcarbamoyltransferase complex ATPase subunit type 1 TsaE n=1 Tax=Schnuerera sp. xch1 TaxID=2874283 RepID=UPI001CBF5818|nr:tRNA (adenosine(37)-N6)-threonylcarbamoyltransferase complex ATPase subunit type 1 TsaE [Schnuerera sp. xch1]MBZ2174872.1 tRNA (adenosine(37)-N6)-threonylcarbamoyltransferase complex ATPase subunit type 1 TsaE [Schnuerera sp. xch1]